MFIGLPELKTLNSRLTISTITGYYTPELLNSFFFFLGGGGGGGEGLVL